MVVTHVIDIDQLVASLTSRIKGESGDHESSKPSIYKSTNISVINIKMPMNHSCSPLDHITTRSPLHMPCK